MLLLAPVGGIQITLQYPVQRLAAQASLAHGGQHLNIKGIRLHVTRKLLPYQLYHMLIYDIYVISLQMEKIPGFVVQRNLLPIVDAVRIDNNVALRRLPENLIQPHHMELLGFNQIPQYAARPHAGKLVDIAY